MKRLKYILLAVLTGNVSALDNSSKTAAYLKLSNNDPIHAVTGVFEDAWGGWFYLMLAASAYLGISIQQRSIHVASIWLVAMLASYNFKILDIPPYIMYLVVVIWIADILIKLLSPEYKN